MRPAADQGTELMSPHSVRGIQTFGRKGIQDAFDDPPADVGHLDVGQRWPPKHKQTLRALMKLHSPAHVQPEAPNHSGSEGTKVPKPER